MGLKSIKKRMDGSKNTILKHIKTHTFFIDSPDYCIFYVTFSNI